MLAFVPSNVAGGRLQRNERVVKAICTAKGGENSHEGGVGLSGKQRRMLRSLAGIMTNDGRLATMAVPSCDAPTEETFLENLENTLCEAQLVKLRMAGVVAKRKEAGRLAKKIIGSLEDEQEREHGNEPVHLVQVVGHTALLYRQSKDIKSRLIPSVVEEEDGQDSGR